MTVGQAQASSIEINKTPSRQQTAVASDFVKFPVRHQSQALSGLPKRCTRRTEGVVGLFRKKTLNDLIPIHPDNIGNKDWAILLEAGPLRSASASHACCASSSTP